MSQHRTRPPGTPGSNRLQVTSLACNSCRKNIVSTCFRVKCDCLFCEDCTFVHFAESDQCPSCGAKPLTERDFTEIPVPDASLAPDLLKTSFQNMLSMRRNSTSITFPEACLSILRQMETTKTTTKFLLRQMIKDSASNSQMNAGYGALKQQNIDIKKQLASVKDLYQRATVDFNTKLHNKEKAMLELQKQNQALERQLDAMRRGVNPSPSVPNIPSSRQGGPPLQGIIAQKQHREAQVLAQQAAIMGGRQVLGSRRGMSNNNGQGQGSIAHRLGTSQAVEYSSPSLIQQQQGALQRSNSYNSGGPMRVTSDVQRQLNENFTPIQNIDRPYTNGSQGSGNRVRELTATSGYNFTSAALSGGHVNKRRRTPTTPTFHSPAAGYGSQSHHGNLYNR